MHSNHNKPLKIKQFISFLCLTPLHSFSSIRGKARGLTLACEALHNQPLQLPPHLMGVSSLQPLPCSRSSRHTGLLTLLYTGMLPLPSLYTYCLLCLEYLHPMYLCGFFSCSPSSLCSIVTFLVRSSLTLVLKIATLPIHLASSISPSYSKTCSLITIWPALLITLISDCELYCSASIGHK